MKKIAAAIVGAVCGLALAVGGVSWAAGSTSAAPAQVNSTVAPGGNAGCC